jgi:glycine/D-amino acid oxidase-like deaminating enzyme
MDLRTGAAFWPLRNGLIAVYPPLERDERCDVAVIGAGITGALAARRLTEADCDVILLDRHDVGMGSTAACTGLLQYETDTSLGALASQMGIERAVRSWRLGLNAINDLETFCTDPSYGFTRRPSVYLASTRWDVRGLQAERALRAERGFDVAWLDRPEIAERFGFKAHGAIQSRGDAEVDAYRLTHGVIADAARRGARVYDRTDVTRVRADRSGVLLTTNRGARVRAKRLVVAAGYEVARQLRQDRGHLHSTWAFVSEPVPDLSWWPDRCLIWETRRPYLYLRTTSDGRVMVGGEDEPWSTRHENIRLLARKTGRLLEGFSKLFPRVRLEVAYAWAGVFGTTPDGLPCIGTIPEHPHTFFALGYGGNGITFSVTAADLVRDWWTGRPNPDAALFAFDR